MEKLAQSSSDSVKKNSQEGTLDLSRRKKRRKSGW